MIEMILINIDPFKLLKVISDALIEWRFFQESGDGIFPAQISEKGAGRLRAIQERKGFKNQKGAGKGGGRIYICIEYPDYFGIGGENQRAGSVYPSVNSES